MIALKKSHDNGRWKRRGNRARGAVPRGKICAVNYWYFSLSNGGREMREIGAQRADRFALRICVGPRISAMATTGDATDLPTTARALALMKPANGGRSGQFRRLRHSRAVTWPVQSPATGRNRFVLIFASDHFSSRVFLEDVRPWSISACRWHGRAALDHLLSAIAASTVLIYRSLAKQAECDGRPSNQIRCITHLSGAARRSWKRVRRV